MSSQRVAFDLLRALKESANSRPGLCIPAGIPVQALLRPVSTKPESLNRDDVRRLTEWRNRFVRSFLTEFEATHERTAQWLVEVVGAKEGKILFMVDDLDGQTFGYMGLDFMDWNKSYGEADAVVRGGHARPGVMKLSLQTLLHWAGQQLGLQTLGVRVRSDNTAVDFYRKVGFREIFRVPLRCVHELGMIRWVEAESLETGQIYLIHMLWEGNPKVLG